MENEREKKRNIIRPKAASTNLSEAVFGPDQLRKDLFEEDDQLEGMEEGEMDEVDVLLKRALDSCEQIGVSLGSYEIGSVESTLLDFEERLTAVLTAPAFGAKGTMSVEEIYQWVSRIRIADSVEALNRFEEAAAGE